jgi:NAD(P)-dependent dehydrogenase (short-subunit alcohol dehydrogenase family)
LIFFVCPVPRGSEKNQFTVSFRFKEIYSEIPNFVYMNTKTAVITGGTRGIGASLVADFLREGWNVAYSGTSPETIEASLAALSGKFPADSYAAFRCDVANESEVISLWEGAVKKFGRVDIWVNNAGKGNDRKLFHNLPSEEIASIIDTNVRGLMLATRIAYKNMLAQGSGAIYNMCGLGSDGRMITGLTPRDIEASCSIFYRSFFERDKRQSCDHRNPLPGHGAYQSHALADRQRSFERQAINKSLQTYSKRARKSHSIPRKKHDHEHP